MLCGCAGSNSDPATALDSSWLTAQGDSAGAIPDADVLGSLPVPTGVELDTWRAITAELRRVLTERNAGRDACATGVYATGACANEACATGTYTTGACATTGRDVSTPPVSAASAAVLAYDEVESTLSWHFASQGDYDQNGEVGISDLTPLGLNFGAVSPGGAGQPFSYASVESVVDGNGDGEINIGDVTPIGVNFGVSCTGYSVYLSVDEADYPAAPTAPNGTGTQLIATVALAQAEGSAGQERLRFSYELDAPSGPAYVWVRPTDGTAPGTPSNLTAVSGANLSPTAVLGVAPSFGFAPLQVQLNAYLSTDADGQIVKYEWDFDGALGGENWVDTGLEPEAQHTYGEQGDFFPTLRVTDDRGATALDFVQVRIKQPPEARLTYNVAPGAFWRVSWTAAGSYDPDGQVMRFQWDFDGDGVYEHDTGAEAVVDFYYYEAGDYPVSVRVTDDDGLTAEASRTAQVYASGEWHVNVVDERLDSELHGDGMRGETTLLNAGGHPAIVYGRLLDEEDPLTEAWYGAAYLRALNPSGSSWPEPEIVFGNMTSAVAIVDGHPAIAAAYRIEIEPAPLFIYDNYDLFIRANEPAGASWADPIVLNEYRTEAGQVPSDIRFGDSRYLFTVEGRPTIFGNSYVEYQNSGAYVRANDASGSSWPALHLHGIEPIESSLHDYAVVGGLVAYVSTINDKDVLYNRGLDNEALYWAEPVLVDELEEVSRRSKLLDAGGYPAVVYFEDIEDTLKYRYALDAEGTVWSTAIVLAPRAEWRFQAGMIDGRPTVLYGDRINDALMLIAANDSQGRLWNLAARVPGNVGTVEFIGVTGTFLSELTDISAKPGICAVHRFTNESEQQGYRLHYMAYD